MWTTSGRKRTSAIKKRAYCDKASATFLTVILPDSAAARRRTVDV